MDLAVGYEMLWKGYGMDLAVGYEMLWKGYGMDLAVGYRMLWKLWDGFSCGIRDAVEVMGWI